LYGAGTNNYLSASGNGTNGAANALFAGSGTATLVATASTFDNQFSGGTGSSTMTSFGAGAQTFFVGSTGQEQMTGATVSGASNNYYFLQDSTGNGSDIITNFTLGRDHLYVNVIGPYSGVSISGVEPLGGGVSGSIVYLSDKTTIQLYGVSAASIQSVVGGSQI
jgi:hypothetical protein